MDKNIPQHIVEKIEAQATNYAESCNSCYSNNYDGFDNGATFGYLLATGRKWINVNDRLPDEQGHYLVIAPKSFPKNCMMVVAEFYEDNGIFYSESGDYPMKDVTHWMELPSLPSKPLPCK